MKQFRAFYIPYLLFVLTFSVLILCAPKADLHLWLTAFHSPFTDTFFSYYTYVGDWLPYAVVAALLFYNYRMAIFVLLSQLGTGLVSILIKNTWDQPRPYLYFKTHFPDVQLYQIAGESLYSHHSFPSGHTITAFAFFLSMAFYSSRKTVHFACFLLAFLVGYSRIYLSQHFAVDVLVGSLLAVSLVTAGKIWFDKYPMLWAEGSLRDVFSRK